MDEAFVTLSELLVAMSPSAPELRDVTDLSRMYIDAFEVETPIELDIARDEHGRLRIGSVPPLYRVDTTLRPAYHAIRFTARHEEEPNG